MSLLFAGIPGVQGGEAQIAPMFRRVDHRIYELELDKYSYREYVESVVHDLVTNTHSYDELVLVGVSMGGIAAIDLAHYIRFRTPKWHSLRLLLICTPFPGSARNLVGAGKAAGVVAGLGKLPNAVLKLGNPIVRAMSGSPLKERGLGATDEQVQAAHRHGATIPFACFARQTAQIVSTPAYAPGDIDGIFNAVGYLGADNHGARDDGVVDWRAARDRFAATFVDTPFYDLGAARGPHAAIPNYPWSYEWAVNRFLQQSRQ